MRLFLLAMLGTTLFVQDDNSRRRFGPEWTREGDYYVRTVMVKVMHSVGGNVAGYGLPLEKDQVYVHEIDDNRGFTIGSEPYGSLEILKNAQGKAREYTVVLGDVRYYDVNGDGEIDARYDRKKGPLIFFEGRYVEVEDSKAGFAHGGRWERGRGAYYVFVGDRWQKHAKP